MRKDWISHFFNCEETLNGGQNKSNISFFISFLFKKNQEETQSYHFNTCWPYRTTGAAKHFSSSKLHDYTVLCWSCLSLSLLK